MKPPRNIGVGVLVVVTCAVSLGIARGCCASVCLHCTAAAVSIPIPEADATWPKMPKKLHRTGGRHRVDSHDHIWVLNRPQLHTAGTLGAEKNPALECCVRNPPVMEFDIEGNYIQGWAGRVRGHAELLERSQREYVGPTMISWIYANMDQPDPAFDWLGKASSARDCTLGFGIRAPVYDRISGDPRFQELLAGLGLLEVRKVYPRVGREANLCVETMLF